ncbi:tRNA (guanine(10)-N(2))-methyltransferase TRMT11 isoform X1 [Rhinoraja longicauda]
MALSSGTAGPRRFLLLLAHENLEFRLPEVKSLFSLCKSQLKYEENFNVKSPFWIVHIPSEEVAKAVMRRTVCAKSIFELWGQGRTHEDLHNSLINYPTDKMIPYLQHGSTYQIKVYAFNKTLSHNERIQRIDDLGFLPFQGTVKLKNPEHEFWLLEDYGTDPNNAPEEPFCIYFGRWIADGQRDLINLYSVKKRHFIGNTSMDAGLSFLIANHAKAGANDLVFDPFVGTGSLLVACAHFGAYVCGADINYNIIHGRGKASRKDQKWRGPDENIRANLRQYGLEQFYVDVLVSDASKNVWRKANFFDAIITDPPYGVRESTRKTGSQKGIIKSAEEYYTEDVIPQHPCLKLISNCEQTLTAHTSRQLITMEKVKEFEDKDRFAHLNDTKYNPYVGHNSFREKYFSGVMKKVAKETKNTQK